MAEGGAAGALLSACIVVLSLVGSASAQSLDTRLATYILAGIAGIYAAISCCCFVTILCVCCKRCRKRKSFTEKQPLICQDEELKGRSHLPPVYEGSELESPATPDNEEGLIFTNVHAEDYQQEGNQRHLNNVQSGRHKEAEIIANKFVLDTDKSRMLKASPLARHTPKILPHPIKVPYSDETSSIDGSEYDVESDLQTSTLNWQESSIKWQENKQYSPQQVKAEARMLKSVARAKEYVQNTPSGSPSPSITQKRPSSTDNTSEGHLRMRKFDSVSHASGERIISPENNSAQVNLTPSSTLQLSSGAREAKTSPLPRSEQLNKGGGKEKTLDLVTLHSALSSISSKWYNIGVQLKVSIKTLSAIRAINRNNADTCMLRVCEEWLTQQRRCNKIPEWITIVAVLRSRVICETKLADSLHQQFCSNESESEEEEEEPTSKSFTWIN